jgi:hypothetical protein
MGSFSEVVMSLILREDTAPDVLAAFSRLADPAMATDGASISQRPARGLPAPHTDRYDDSVLWEEPDPGYRPWMFDWSSYLSAGHTNVYVASAKSATLAWAGFGWLLSFRTTTKAYPADLARGFAWFGEHAIGGDENSPYLVGYMKHEYELRPWLVWGRGGPLSFENLNVPEDHGLSDADIALLRGHMWRATNEGNRRLVEAQLRRAAGNGRMNEMLTRQLEVLNATPVDPPDEWTVPLDALISYRDRLWQRAIGSSGDTPPAAD